VSTTSPAAAHNTGVPVGPAKSMPLCEKWGHKNGVRSQI
jgi:hypothetical protein